MKRIVAVIVVIGVIAGLGVGLFFLGESGGPAAATIGDTRISSQSLDEELSTLYHNDALRQAAAAATQQAAQTGQEAMPLTSFPETVTGETAAGWLSLVIAQTAAADAVARRGLEPTAADRQRGTARATQSLGGEAIFETMPKWFRDRVVDRWTDVAVLERDETEHPSDTLVELLAARCPSGRYVSHILVATEAEAVALKQQLDAGADFAELAMQSSTDTGTAQGGGALGCVDDQTFEPFATVAKTQPIGVVSDPFATEFGTHLVLVTDETPAEIQEQVVLTAALAHSRRKHVEIDPRYGTWDRPNGTVKAPVPPTKVPRTTVPLAPAPAAATG